MIRDIIKDKLTEKVWTFGEIADISKTVNELAEYAYETMTAKEKLDVIWNLPLEKWVIGKAESLPIDTDRTYGQYFYVKCMQELKRKIAIIIKEELSEATVVFKEDNKNEVFEGSVGGESHKERTTDEKKDTKQSS